MPGTLLRARVNRDGIGAVLSFTPLGGPTVMSPVTAGSSHLSQHSPERLFGLGESRLGTLEILWPGGVRNRFYGVRHGERLELPEIPCSFDTEGPFVPYIACLSTALFDLLEEQRIDRRLGLRLYTSAIFAFLDRQ